MQTNAAQTPLRIARDASGDLAAALVETPVATLLRTDTECLAPEVSLELATEIFLERGLSSAPILDEDGRVAGSVTREDLLRAWQARARSGTGPLDPRRLTVASVMTMRAECLPSSAPLSAAFCLLAREGVHQVLVVSSSRRLIGTINARDILRWIALQQATAASA